MFARLSLLLTLLALGITAHAEYVLSAPPRESAAVAQAIYSPLADELARIVGEPVRFVAPSNWSDYGQSIREGKYDFVFDGPHFVAWRIKNASHVPLVSLPGEISFWVAAHEEVNSLQDLRFQSVCSLPTPNLATLVLLSQFDPFQTPEVITGRGGIKGVFAAFQEHRCKAVVLRDLFVRNIPEAQAKDLHIIFRSVRFPELTLTAGPRVPKAKHAAIVSALTQASATAATRPILESLGGKNAAALIPARGQSTFLSYHKLLEDNMWGWYRKKASAQERKTLSVAAR